MPKTKTTSRDDNLQALATMPEISVFMASYYGFRQYERPDLTEPEREQLVQVLDDTVEATYRFCIVWPVMVDLKGQRKYSPFFWRWFNWWFDWLILKHTPEQLQYLSQLAQSRSPELLEWRPPGDWLHYRAERPPNGPCLL